MKLLFISPRFSGGIGGHASMLAEKLIEYGFDVKIEQLKKDNKWKEIEFFKSNYIASKDVNAWLGLYEVIK